MEKERNDNNYDYIEGIIFHMKNDKYYVMKSLVWGNVSSPRGSWTFDTEQEAIKYCEENNMKWKKANREIMPWEDDERWEVMG